MADIIDSLQVVCVGHKWQTFLSLNDQVHLEVQLKWVIGILIWQTELNWV